MRGEFIDVGEHRLYYYAAGTRGQGEPIILIHGFPTSSHLWERLVPLLPDGRRIVVPDLLGFGRSDLGERANVGVRGHADRLVALMDELGIRRAALVGHHMGAVIAADVASRHGERVTHLVLLHPLGGDVTFTGTFAVFRAFLPLVRLLPAPFLRGAVRREVSHWFADEGRARPSVDQYLAVLFKPPRWKALLRQLSALDPADVSQCTSALSSVRCPIAIVAGDHDPAVPRVALDRLRASAPGASLDMLRDSRHFSPEESPEQVAEIVGRLLAA